MTDRDPRNYTQWTDAMDRELKRLWRLHLSSAKISSQMGVSKNAVVARARRIGLPGRPSPILQATQTPRAQPLPPGAHTLPPLPSEMGQ